MLETLKKALKSKKEIRKKIIIYICNADCSKIRLSDSDTFC